MSTSRQAAVRALVGAAAVLSLTSCVGGDDPDPAPSGSLPPTTDPALTAPPSLTPEEQAEADIQATFEELIADRDAYYSDAGDYTLEEVETNSPVTEWNVTGPAELEMSNWTVLWRQGETHQVGAITITSHSVSDLQPSINGGLGGATSTACLDLSSLAYETYAGKTSDLPYTPDELQLWAMTWVGYAEPHPEAGIAKPGWYVESLELTRNVPC